MKHPEYDTHLVGHQLDQTYQTTIYGGDCKKMNEHSASQSGPSDEQIYYNNIQLNSIKKQKLKVDTEEYFKNMNYIMGLHCLVEKLKNRRVITWTAVTTMVFALIASYLLIALTGLGYMKLPDELIHYLGVSTIGSIVSTGMIVFKYQIQSEPINIMKNH